MAVAALDLTVAAAAALLWRRTAACYAQEYLVVRARGAQGLERG